MDELRALLELISGNGQAALIVSVYFIWRLERRLLSIEAALSRYLKENSGGAA